MRDNTDSLTKLMSEILIISETFVIKKHQGDLKIRNRKYAQIRLAGIAHALFADITTLVKEGCSARTLEILTRPLIEVYINFRWIGLDQGVKNFSLYVMNDNMSMAKQAERIIKYYKSHPGNDDQIIEWRKIQALNLKQAKDALKASKLIQPKEKYPTISEKARMIDSNLPGGEDTFEWMVLFPYSFAHMAVHVTNRQLNRMLDEESEISIYGSSDEIERSAFDATVTFLALLEDYNNIFKMQIDLSSYWSRVGSAIL